MERRAGRRAGAISIERKTAGRRRRRRKTLGRRRIVGRRGRPGGARGGEGEPPPPRAAPRSRATAARTPARRRPTQNPKDHHATRCSRRARRGWRSTSSRPPSSPRWRRWRTRSSRAAALTRANAAAFFEVLEAGMAPTRLRDAPLRVAYRRLYTAALAREALFSSLSARHASKMGEWRLRVLTQLDVYTDDTYQFAPRVQGGARRSRSCRACTPRSSPRRARSAARRRRTCPRRAAEAWVASVRRLETRRRWSITSTRGRSRWWTRSSRRRRPPPELLGDRAARPRRVGVDHQGAAMQRQQAAARATREAEKGYAGHELRGEGGGVAEGGPRDEQGRRRGPRSAMDNWMAKQANNFSAF